MQGTKKCTPEGRDCIENRSAEIFDCSMTCEGMYADISWKIGHPDGKMKDGKDKKKYAELYSEYQNFKKENVKHFRFSSEAHSSSGTFGKQILQ